MILRYKKSCPEELQLAYKQTVLAGFAFAIASDDNKNKDNKNEGEGGGELKIYRGSLFLYTVGWHLMQCRVVH